MIRKFLIQIGTLGGRYFAAWGNGVPNGAGSSYVQRDLGPTSPGWHVYALRNVRLGGHGPQPPTRFGAGWWAVA